MNDVRPRTTDCPTIEGYDTPFCVLAQRSSLERKLALDAIHATALAGLDEAQRGETKFLNSRFKIIADHADDERITVGVVPYDDLVASLVEELEGAMSTDARSLVELAQRIAHFFTTGGWTLVQLEFLHADTTEEQECPTPTS